MEQSDRLTQWLVYLKIIKFINQNPECTAQDIIDYLFSESEKLLTKSEVENEA